MFKLAGYRPRHIDKLIELENHQLIQAFLDGMIQIKAGEFCSSFLFEEGVHFAKEPTLARIKCAKDIGKVRILSTLKGNEGSVSGYESCMRLYDDFNIPLGEKDLSFFLENKDLIPDEWKKFDTIFFDADTLVSEDGYGFSLYLGWVEHENDWISEGYSLDEGRDKKCYSAVTV